jgi:hypothetical protein
MKMREELELYKGKCADLEDKLELRGLEFNLAMNTEKDKSALAYDALVIAHNIEVSEMTAKYKKELESKDNTIKYRNDNNNELTEQVNNLHDILDVIPGVMARKKDGEYNSTENKCHVRLASVLAQKFM